MSAGFILVACSQFPEWFISSSKEMLVLDRSLVFGYLDHSRKSIVSELEFHELSRILLAYKASYNEIRPCALLFVVR